MPVANREDFGLVGVNAFGSAAFLWPGMLMDGDRPERRLDAVCVDCEAKLNSYNAAQNIRCYGCYKKWNVKADELAEPMKGENFGMVSHDVAKARFDRLIFAFIEGLAAKATNIYYGNAFQEIAERTGRDYEGFLRTRSRVLVRRGELTRPNDTNKLWAMPEAQIVRWPDAEIMVSGNQWDKLDLMERHSRYEGVSWDDYNRRWMAIYYDWDLGYPRTLGHARTELEAHEIWRSFVEMKERKESAFDVDTEVGPSEEEIELLMEDIA